MTGQKLRQIRRRLGMSQPQLGEVIGLNGNSIARMERGEWPIKRTTELAVKFLVLTMRKKRGRK